MLKAKLSVQKILSREFMSKINSKRDISNIELVFAKLISKKELILSI